MKENEELENLAKQYSVTKDRETLTKIFEIIMPLLKQKASWIYYVVNFRGTKLCETNQCALSDVFQELAVKVIEILISYNPEKSFTTYLIGTLWNYKPSAFRNNDFYNYRHHNDNTKIVNGEEIDIIDNLPAPDPYSSDLLSQFENLTDNEIKIIKLFEEDGNITQSQIAKIIGITPSGVSLIIKKLAKKYIKEN